MWVRFAIAFTGCKCRNGVATCHTWWESTRWGFRRGANKLGGIHHRDSRRTCEVFLGDGEANLSRYTPTRRHFIADGLFLFLFYFSFQLFLFLTSGPLKCISPCSAHTSVSSRAWLYLSLASSRARKLQGTGQDSSFPFRVNSPLRLPTT